jgi:hypothetical protein
MWHTWMLYLDDLLKSDLVFYSVIVSLCVFAWLACTLIDQWEARRAVNRARRRQCEAALGRTLRSQVRADLSSRLAKRVDERRDPFAPNRPMWLKEPADRAQSAAHRTGAQGIVTPTGDTAA